MLVFTTVLEASVVFPPSVRSHLITGPEGASVGLYGPETSLLLPSGPPSRWGVAVAVRGTTHVSPLPGSSFCGIMGS